MKPTTQTSIFPEHQGNSTNSKTEQVAPIIIYIDGASRGNPGPSGVGVWLSSNNKDILHTNGFLGIKTNNQAEYLALALALFHLKKIANKEQNRVIIRSDSLLLVKQMRGEYAIKNPFIKALAPLIATLKMGFTCTFQHVPREKNSIADAEANKGIDNRAELPVEFKKLISHY
ncbi:ribonuclease HI family protein [Candidatus Babeliales bacterium]|nr:ribonuclease HI family protein [Candidatus Babeliales bacterium]